MNLNHSSEPVGRLDAALDRRASLQLRAPAAYFLRVHAGQTGAPAGAGGSLVSTPGTRVNLRPIGARDDETYEVCQACYRATVVTECARCHRWLCPACLAVHLCEQKAGDRG